MKKSFKENWHIWALAVIMLAAFFVRVWSLDEMLYFNLDQARDAIISKDVHDDGAGMLPLLGPRAAGTFLRLGPAFYYFQAISVFVFQSAEPLVLVFPEIILSVLTIPLLFFFFWQFFRKWTSVFLSGLFGMSFLAVQYSRFAWNPNQTPFWSILFLLSIYKAATHVDRKKAGWWLVCAAIAYGILSQLHFTSLLAFPIITAVFWIFYQPRKIKLFFWFAAVAALLLLYVPMLLSEVTTGWDNVDQFKYALTHKSKEYPLSEKIQKSFQLHGKYYSLALTSYGNLSDKVFGLFFVVMIIFAILRSRKIWQLTEDKEKKAFLFLMGIWFLVFAFLYTKLAFTVLKPRFWLLIMPLAYFVLGLFLETVYCTGHKKRGKYIVAAVVLFLMFTNSYAIGYWYWSVENQKQADHFVRNLVLKQGNLVAIKQMKQIAAHIKTESEYSGKQICYYTEAAYRWPYMYLFRLQYPEVSIKRIKFAEDTNDQCIFFSIKNGGSVEKPKLPDEYESFFEELKRSDFGVIRVWQIEKKEEAFLEYQKTKMMEKKKIDQQAISAPEDENEDEDEESENDDEKPDRKERVFWKDLFSGSYEDQVGNF